MAKSSKNQLVKLTGLDNKTIIQQLPVGIAIVELKTGRFIQTNKKFEEITGYTESELLKTNFQSITHPDDLGKDLDNMKKLENEKLSSYRMEKRYIHKKGHIIWVDLTVVFNNKPDDKGMHYHLATIADITKNKLAEQNLKSSEELLRTVITNAPISIFATDEKGVFTLHEGKALERLGMKPSENVGHSAYDLFSELPVTEYNGNTITGKEILDRVNKGEYLSGITQLNNVIFDNQFTPIIDENDKIAGMLGVATDITEQKKYEKERLAFERRYRQLFTEIDEGFCIIEVIFDGKNNPFDYRFLEINPAFEKHTGLTNVIGKRIRELFPSQNDRWSEIYGKIALTGKPKRFTRHSKILSRWFDVYAFQFESPAEKQVAILFSDITERKNAEEELQKREKELREAQRIGKIGSWEWDVEGNKVLWSDELYHIVQLEDNIEELTYDHTKSVVHPDDVLFWENALQEALSENKPFNIDHRVVRPDNSVIWVHNEAEVIFDDNGNPTIVKSTVQDITQRKLKEAEVEEYKSFLRNIIDSNPNIIFVVDKKTNILLANEAFANFYSTTVKNVEGKLQKQIHDDYQMSVSEFDSWQKDNNIVLDSNKSIERIEFGHRKDGYAAWYQTRKVPITLTNNEKAVLVISEDISNLKSIEEALRQSEKELNAAQRLAKIGSWEWDARTDDIKWSEEYFRIYGFDPKIEPPGYEEHLNVYSPESQKQLDDAVKKSMQTGEPYEVDLELNAENVKEKWIRARGECRFGENNNIIGLHGTAQDITERKKQEEELRYRAEIAAHISEGVSLVRLKDGIIVHASRRFEEMFGYNYGELTGKHVDILNATDADSTAQEKADTIIDTVQQKGKWNGRLLNVKKDGTPFWTHGSVTQFNHPSYGEVLITIQMDITEQMEAENALYENEPRQRAMITNISDVIAVIDINGIVIYKSPNVEKEFGWKPKDLLGRNVFKLIHSNDLKHIKDSFYKLLDEPKEIIHTECRYLCKDGDYKWIELTAVNQLNNDVIKGILVNYHDVSSRKSVEEKLLKYKDELKLLSSELINIQENEKKELAQELHDEVGQALTAMKINLSTIKSIFPPGHNQNAEQRINETNEILDNIINQVHKLSLNLSPALLEVLGLSATLKDYCNQFSKRTGIKVICQKDESKMNMPNKYEINIFRIVQEALTNIARHSKAKTVSVSFETVKKKINLKITDDGIGFDIRKYDDNSEKKTGIGLLGMRERVNAMRGTMKITSEKGKGTTIDIQIPLGE